MKLLKYMRQVGHGVMGKEAYTREPVELQISLGNPKCRLWQIVLSLNMWVAHLSLPLLCSPTWIL